MAIPGFPSLDYTTSRTWKRHKSLITNESFKASRALVLLTKVEKKLAGKIVPRCTHFTGASSTSFPGSLLRLLTHNRLKTETSFHWVFALTVFVTYRGALYRNLAPPARIKKNPSHLHFILARREVELQIPLVWFMRLPHDLKFLYPGDRLNTSTWEMKEQQVWVHDIFLWIYDAL